ncbi:MAG TPA: cyclase family protein [Phycisphaerales bacterium]|nr:cyclase family protein [Phycisphaerales bacterium]
MKVYDISPVLTARTAVWPGDTPLAREVLCDLARGDSVTLSTLRSTVHLGAHADGPNHYALDASGGAVGAPGIGERSLEYYLGACQVVSARVGRGERVRPEHLLGALGTIAQRRVLVRTDTFRDPTSFNEDFAALSVELVDELARRGVVTIGIDTPSVDLFASKTLEAHRAMHAHDMAILEGLVLGDVPPGTYELIALPLRLLGFDASPVRAVLRDVPGGPPAGIAVGSGA